MEKRKLTILISLSILSIYGIARIEKLSATDSQSVTEKTITPPVGSSGPAGLTPYMPQTSSVLLNNTQLGQIRAGTFLTSPGNVACPPTDTVNCGTPNTVPTRVGTSTCPTICYVAAIQNGPPPIIPPYGYPSCPKGYAVISPGNYDLYYTQQPADVVYPSSNAALTAYQNRLGYTCSPDPATNIYNCPSGYAQGTYYPMNNRLYSVVSRECRLAGSCWGNVDCNVAHSVATNIQAMRCIRPAGYHPAPAQYGSTTSLPVYQMAPQSLICGLIYTTWSPG